VQNSADVLRSFRALFADEIRVRLSAFDAASTTLIQADVTNHFENKLRPTNLVDLEQVSTKLPRFVRAD